MADRLLNMRPDPPDLRDRLYNPTLRSLARELNARPFEDPVAQRLIQNQEQTQACTGFALAGLVEGLAWKAWAGSHESWPAPKRFSPYMLYYLARRYDDIPGDDPERGSTARAAMKAWHKHGACEFEYWDQLDQNPCTADRCWRSNAFQTPLGAYYRVDHTSIPDVHAALNEVGFVFVTAQVHQGWEKPEEGQIAYQTSWAPIGGHAFLLVGYDPDGFWIQNSWGAAWGLGGMAHLSYADWTANCMDAWIGQLGVRVSAHAQELEEGLNAGTAAQTPGTVVDKARAMLSSDPSVSAQQINPYVVNLTNNGTLSDNGQFHTTVDDLKALVTTYLDQALEKWDLKDSGKPIDIALYAHGGLTPESGAAETARLWVPALFAAHIFPVFFMWETGLPETLGDILHDRIFGTPRAAGVGLLDWIFSNERLETLLSGPGTAVWSEMKQNARFASVNSDSGGLAKLYQVLLAERGAEFCKRLRFHLIGHSAGAIFHAYLLPALVDAKLNVDGLYLMAPACRLGLFKRNILPLLDAGKLPSYTQFHLSDPAELGDVCAIPKIESPKYTHSLLYLVSNSFEHLSGPEENAGPGGAGTVSSYETQFQPPLQHNEGRPIQGMEKFFTRDTDFMQRLTGGGAAAGTWDVVTAPTPKVITGRDGVEVPDVAHRSDSRSHGGFSGDHATTLAVIARIKGTPSGTPPAGASGGEAAAGNAGGAAGAPPPPPPPGTLAAGAAPDAGGAEAPADEVAKKARKS